MARHSKGVAQSAKQHSAVRGRPAQSRAAELDRVIHEPVRLGIVSALAANETMTFNELKELLRTTDGNLSVHARKLEENERLRVHRDRTEAEVGVEHDDHEVHQLIRHNVDGHPPGQAQEVSDRLVTPVEPKPPPEPDRAESETPRST